MSWESHQACLSQLTALYGISGAWGETLKRRFRVSCFALSFRNLRRPLGWHCSRQYDVMQFDFLQGFSFSLLFCLCLTFDLDKRDCLLEYGVRTCIL